VVGRVAAAVRAFRQESAEHSAVKVPGLDHETLERRGTVDGGERQVDQVAGDRGRVHQKPVGTRHPLRVFCRVARVSGRHVLARDLQHVVGDRLGAGAGRPQSGKRYRDRGHPKRFPVSHKYGADVGDRCGIRSLEKYAKTDIEILWFFRRQKIDFASEFSLDFI